jgi:hypothetical protein
MKLILKSCDSKAAYTISKWYFLKYKGIVELIESEFDSETGNIALDLVFQT